MAQNGVPNSWNAAHVPHDSALSVGSSKQEEDAARIRELESEVSDLAEKANAASQRFADYENEIRVLEATLRQEQRKNSTISNPDGSDNLQAAEKTVERPSLSRFGSIMGTRSKSGPVPQIGAVGTSSAKEKDLEEKLIKEQITRIAAEKKVKEVNAEIEDLSATLFQQANEMVATERKENAALRDKIRVLEQHEEELKDPEALQKENVKLKEKIETLQQREVDRKRRIERLESANKRIERVRAMLQPP
ncbi:hypothetical protein LTR37_014425 [Vermiconidia calcicola]|uniref:Uncharacterized protein n=1 Tax=Vermiconidia calcicola TaxID=1690605 RepID=A0ACC3MTM1_9PEZI|nr:hypothetical protein LTR37_014425 [Vermiconidia calcicola]